jgi:uncharacterized FAD-dependent dehydrogenase
MLRVTELKLPLGHPAEALPEALAARLKVAPGEIRSWTVARRANDARKRSAILMVYSVDVVLKDEAAVLARLKDDPHVRPSPDTGYKFLAKVPADYSGPRPIVIGAGPCGLFAGLILAQMGLKPIILDRGKAVRERTKDTWGLWRRGVLDPESNVQFGEGGAGTFSDGKLYSQIKDPRHLGRKVLEEFVKAGAPEEILTEAHPHIGTFRLVTMVESLRQTISELGGEYRFGHRVTGLVLGQDRRVEGVVTSDDQEIAARHVVLAPGHSSRDTFESLHALGVHIEAKPFSIGVRIEHPQSWIDRARFGACAGHPDLGAAAYALSHHCSNGRTVYSFCMCPGGTVVAATSEEGRVVTNGMSQYSRNERNANSGLVVAIDPERDYPGHPLAGIALQRHWETLAFTAGGGGYKAPVPAGRASDGPVAMPARLRHRGPTRGLAGVRPPDPPLRRSGRGDDGRRDPHLLAHPHHPRRRLPEPQHPRPLSRRRGRGLRRRHPLGRGRRHQGRRGGGAAHSGGLEAADDCHSHSLRPTPARTAPALTR